MTDTAIRVADEGAARRLTFCRPDAYNTITPQLRDELAQALDDANRARHVRVILLDAEGPAFCAGYGLDWSTASQASDDDTSDRVWDTTADLHLIGSFAATWAKLHESTKPTIAAVQGWCIAGGTNIVFNAHMILAAESARFGYPPLTRRAVPEAPWTWVARMGMQRARRLAVYGIRSGAIAAGSATASQASTSLNERSVAVRPSVIPWNHAQYAIGSIWGLTRPLRWPSVISSPMVRNISI